MKFIKHIIITLIFLIVVCKYCSSTRIIRNQGIVIKFDKNEELNVNQKQEIHTLKEITNTNIGDYIDLGNDIIGEEVTTDDWRVLYVDEEKVYAILAGYLPNDNNLAKLAGLDVGPYAYSVFSNKSKYVLMSNIKNIKNWKSLANNKKGAVVTGTPTAEMLIESYNIRHNTNLNYKDYLVIDVEDSLYIPYARKVGYCNGYWLATNYFSGNNYMWDVCYNGGVNGHDTIHLNYALRPVVALPLDLQVEKNNEIWIVK